MNLTTKQARTALTLGSADTKFSWLHLLFLAVLHAGAVASFLFFSWENVALTLALTYTTGAGLVIGYHRLLAHRSFVAPVWLESGLVLLGSLTLEGGPITWTATHRQHHAHADQEGDPHDISRGFFYAHIGWIFFRFSEDFEDQCRARYARDVSRRRLYRWLERFHYLPNLILGAALFAAGGMPLFLWGMCTRLVLQYHSTWLLNSVGHLWGTRPFESAAGRNNWWVALLTLGEGWHNNHHAHPSSARCGLKPLELDVAWLVIRLLRRLGLAQRVVTASSLSSKVSPG